MCGICGIIGNEAIDPRHLIEMNDIVSHRGPDDEGYWVWNGGASCGKFFQKSNYINSKDYIAGMGHRRLSIIDLSNEARQPMATPDKRKWICFNGEIYNYIEIKKDLINSGYAFRTQSDTEVALIAYCHYGTDCFKRFNGMWGMSIVDMDRRQLILSRDRLGIKPLYFWTNNSSLAYASEIKQFYGLPHFEAKADIDALVEYVDTGYESTEATFFRNVRSFPAGTYAEIALDRPGSFETRPFWFPEKTKPIHMKVEDALERTRVLFEDAVRIRLRSDVPVGVCLSGGLDSSCIYGQMKRLLGENKNSLNAFSAAFDEKAFDERRYMEFVLKKFGGIPHYAFPKPEGFLSDLDDFVYQHDEPVGSMSQYAAWEVMRLARKFKVPVLLNGQGGDEVFSGYWASYYQFIGNRLRQAPFYVGKHLFGSLKAGGNPDLMFQIIPHLRRYWHRRNRKSRMLVRKRFSDRGFTVSKNWAIESQTISPREYRFAELRKVHLPRLLKWDDRNSMAFSIEGRYPFLDYRLIEWVLSLPLDINFHRGWNKYLIRRSFDNILPPEVQWRRSKIGFQTPQSVWIKTGLRTAVETWSKNTSGRFHYFIGKRRFDAFTENLFNMKKIHKMDEKQIVMVRLFLLDRWLNRFKIEV